MFKKKQNEDAPEMSPFPDLNPTPQYVQQAPREDVTQLRQMVQTRPQISGEIIDIKALAPQGDNEFVSLTIVALKRNVRKNILTEAGRFTLGKVVVVQ